MLAAQEGHTETVALLLDRGAEGNKIDRVSSVACIACVELRVMNLME